MVASGHVEMVVVLAVVVVMVEVVFVLKIYTLVDLNIRNKKQSIPGDLRHISSPCHCLPHCCLCFGSDRTRRGGGRHIKPEVY